MYHFRGFCFMVLFTSTDSSLPHCSFFSLIKSYQCNFYLIRSFMVCSHAIHVSWRMPLVFNIVHALLNMLLSNILGGRIWPVTMAYKLDKGRKDLNKTWYPSHWQPPPSVFHPRPSLFHPFLPYSSAPPLLKFSSTPLPPSVFSACKKNTSPKFPTPFVFPPSLLHSASPV